MFEIDKKLLSKSEKILPNNISNNVICLRKYMVIMLTICGILKFILIVIII